MSITEVIPATINAEELKEMASKNYRGAFVSARLLSQLLIGEDNEGLLSLSEYAYFFRNLRLSTSLPLVADGQSGFGSALNVFETNKELARSGADYILINDQEFPSNSFSPKKFVGLSELLGRVKAGLDGLQGSNAKLLIKLEGINFYGMAGLKKRIQVLRSYNVAIVLSQITPTQLSDFQKENLLIPFGCEFNSIKEPLFLDHEESKLSFILKPKDNSIKENRVTSKSKKNISEHHYSKFEKMRKSFSDQIKLPEEIINMVVAPDSLSAKIAETIGFKAIFSAGHATSASNLAAPDHGLADFGVMLNKCREIVNAVNIPVFADADTGYGNIANVERTVRSFESIGACGLVLEDQAWPIEYNNNSDRRIENPDVLVKKIKAAVRSRKNNDFLIMARTDSRKKYGLADAIDRSKQYLSAGADLVFIDGPQSENELIEEVESLPTTPLMVNMIEGGETPFIATKKLEKMGFKIVVYPTVLLYGQAYISQKILSTLKKTGQTKTEKRNMVSVDELNKFLGVDNINDREMKYSEDKMVESLRKLYNKGTRGTS